MENYPNTPIIVQLLATTLARFMEMANLNGQRWSKRLVAAYITSSENITGKISDTTLGRFLDTEHPQKPSDETVSVIAQFLISRRAITPHQIELASTSSLHWKANVFIDAFDPPETASYRSFLRDLSGRYVAMKVESSTLLLCEIILEHLPISNALVVYETLSSYHISDLSFLSHKTFQFDPVYAGIVDQYLKQPIARLELSLVSTGFVIASTSLAAFFNKPTGRGFTSVFNVSNILFSQHDKIVGFKGSRNTGWHPEEPGQQKKVPRLARKTSKLDMVKFLSTELSFFKVFSEKIQKLRDTETGIGSKKKIHSKDFSFDTEKIMSNIRGNISNNENSRKADEQLDAAFLSHDLDEFVLALKNGADPNIIPTGYSDPLVFLLACDGEYDWVLPMVNSGRCTLNITDRNGFTPSHSPGVMSRSFNQSGHSSVTSNRFTRLFELLQKYEIEQLKALDTQPGPTI